MAIGRSSEDVRRRPDMVLGDGRTSAGVLTRVLITVAIASGAALLTAIGASADDEPQGRLVTPRGRLGTATLEVRTANPTSDSYAVGISARDSSPGTSASGAVVGPSSDPGAPANTGETSNARQVGAPRLSGQGGQAVGGPEPSTFRPAGPGGPSSAVV